MQENVPSVLSVLRQACIECRACALRQGKVAPITPVFGRRATAETLPLLAPIRIVIVGEAPGPTENTTGRPFVGKSGEILDSIMRQASLDLARVWITNAAACWPHEPGSRPDRPETFAPPHADLITCAGLHLDRQLDAFTTAKVIVALGSSATDATIGRLDNGKTTRVKRLGAALAFRPGERSDAPKVHEWRGRKVLVGYHPAYLARRAYSASSPAITHEDAETLFRTMVAARELAGG